MKLSKIKQLIKEELFRAYHGRYRFDVDKAYKMIDNGNIDYKITQLDPNKLKLTDPAFTSIDNKHADEIKIDYSKPIGLVVKFENPETKETESLLIDGNHRTTKAMKENRPALYYVLDNPEDAKKFMTFDSSVPHKLFLDDED
jgi:hypothetical protein